MAEEIRKQTEETAEANACDDSGSDVNAKSADTAQETADQQERPEEQEPQETDGKTDAEEESGGCSDKEPEESGNEEVVDGDFVKADQNSKKSSFFRKKKDKKDEKIEELIDKVQRQMAEFDNFRKRSDKEKTQMFDMGAKSVIEKILPVIDNFERGLAQAGENSEDPFVQGMEKIYKQMLTELESIGVKPIEAEGKEFDPNLHNAVMHCEDDTVGENTVVQELQKGYTYHDSVVRHSMVKVAN